MTGAPTGQAEMTALAWPENLEIDDLRDLMRSVNETAARLEQTHSALREEVARLKGDLAEANAALRRSRSLAALGEMAAGIAHEVRNPLGSIQLYVQVLAEELAADPEQAAVCEKIERAVVGLDAIVRDVLQFARDMTIAPAETTADHLFRRALAGCESLIVGGSVNVDDQAVLSCPLRVDVNLMTQALANVIRNAIEAIMAAADQDAANPRALRLSANAKTVRCPDGRQHRRVVLTVEDSGAGVPDDVLQRMFNPFFTTRKTGTGLGLAIVHRIVDAHGGHVAVRNRSGGGARFDLHLPEAPSGEHVRPHAASVSKDVQNTSVTCEQPSTSRERNSELPHEPHTDRR